MRLLILLLAALAMSAGLLYALGWWALLGSVVAVIVVCMVSARPGRGIEATRGGEHTGYDTGLGG